MHSGIAYRNVLSCLGAAAFLAATLPLARRVEAIVQHKLDLTVPVPEDQRGRTDMPGGQGSWHTGQSVNFLTLPLTVRITNSSLNESGDLVLELVIENAGASSFDIPIGRDVRRVEEVASKSRSLFFIKAMPVLNGRLAEDSIALSETAGSAAVSGSLLHLEPHNSIQVLMPVNASDLKKPPPAITDRVEIRIVCSLWQLDDQHYAINAVSKNVPSVNTVVIAIRPDKLELVKP